MLEATCILVDSLGVLHVFVLSRFHVFRPPRKETQTKKKGSPPRAHFFELGPQTSIPTEKGGPNGAIPSLGGGPKGQCCQATLHVLPRPALHESHQFQQHGDFHWFRGKKNWENLRVADTLQIKRTLEHKVPESDRRTQITSQIWELWHSKEEEWLWCANAGNQQVSKSARGHGQRPRLVAKDLRPSPSALPKYTTSASCPRNRFVWQRSSVSSPMPPEKFVKTHRRHMLRQEPSWLRQLGVS